MYLDIKGQTLFIATLCANFKHGQLCVTSVCYESMPYVAPDLGPVKKKKKESLYQKLKPLYEKQMAEYSETIVLSDRYKKASKKWYGTFFDTKVENTGIAQNNLFSPL